MKNLTIQQFKDQPRERAIFLIGVLQNRFDCKRLKIRDELSINMFSEYFTHLQKHNDNSQPELMAELAILALELGDFKIFHSHNTMPTRWDVDSHLIGFGWLL